jgi:hypothetical protein
MPREIRIKQGASLLLQLTFQSDAGAAIDLTNVSLASQVRDAEGNLIATLPIVPTSTDGVATVTVANTSLWPLGTLRGDIKATIGAVVALSETFSIRVDQAVTQ